MNSKIQIAIEFAGSQTALAKKLGVTQQNVWNWLHRDKKIPVERAIQIERVTNEKVKRHDLRPDIFDAPSEDKSTAA